MLEDFFHKNQPMRASLNARVLYDLSRMRHALCPTHLINTHASYGLSRAEDRGSRQLCNPIKARAYVGLAAITSITPTFGSLQRY